MVKLIGEILKDLYGIKEEEINKALQIQKEVKNYIGQILIQLGSITETQLVQALSIQLNLPIFQNEEIEIEELINRIDPFLLNFLLDHGFIPFHIDEYSIYLATSDPLKLHVTDYVYKKFSLSCKLFLAEDRKIKELKRKFGQPKEVNTFVVETDVEKLKDMALEAPVVKYLNELIYRVVELKASDIHLEPSSPPKVRVRIDGVLHDFDTLEEEFFLAVVSRIKLLSGLDIAEKRLPQDGKFYSKIGPIYVDLRVSTIPTIKGEDLVVRILYRGNTELTIKELGLEEDHLEIVKQMITEPYGMLLVTGPTGSGKTTTLYAIISYIKSPEKKFITIEDPVEYQINELTQIQVKPEIGLTFAHALRSILRHDPDVIMIGEIRDTETAQIAVQSALTGHLMLSTLHTNDSISTLFRLMDMGIEPYLINASLIGVIAQRIIRTNCPHCSEEVGDALTLLTKQELKEVYDKFNYLIDKVSLKKGKGCKNCFNTGFKGRTAIFEILTYDEELKEAFIKNPSLSHLKDFVKKTRKFRTLREDGFLKVLKGKTSIEEVLRVS